MTGLARRACSITLAAILAVSLSVPGFAAATIRANLAKSVFKLVNQERDEAGLAAYTWDADLAKAAELRAQEIAEHYDPDHKRPSGAKYYTVSTKVWGENIVNGYDSASDIMRGWMRSAGHRENILKDNFTIIGVGCAEAGDGKLYWVQLFGNGKTNTGWTGATEYTYDPFGQDGITIKSDSQLAGSVTPEQKLGNLVGVSGEVNRDRVLSDLQKAVDAGDKSVNITVKNGKTISSDTLKALGEAAKKAGVTLTLTANTMSESGKAVQGQIVLNPEQLTKRTTSVKLQVTTDSASVKPVKERTEEKYTGKMAYIHMEHRGTLTARTGVSAKVSLAGLKQSQLKFYVYDWDKEAHVLLEDPEYRVDSNGYLHFYTKTAGDIVIADYAL